MLVLSMRSGDDRVVGGGAVAPSDHAPDSLRPTLSTVITPSTLCDPLAVVLMWPDTMWIREVLPLGVWLGE